MKKSDINPMPEYFDRYINLLGDVELSEAFDQSLRRIESLDLDLLKRLDGKIYAPDKWTVKTILQHVIDFERIFCYRALLFARQDKNLRQGVDEQLLAATANANRREIEETLAELKAVRLASKALFESFDEEMLRQTGICWQYEMPVLSLGFTILGHDINHFRVIKEKYYPLAEQANSAV